MIGRRPRTCSAATTDRTVAAGQRKLPQGNESCRTATKWSYFTRQTSNSALNPPDLSPYRNPTTGSFSTAKLVPFFAATDKEAILSLRVAIGELPDNKMGQFF